MMAKLISSRTPKLYEVKSNGNREPLGTDSSLEMRLLSVGFWFLKGEIDANDYLQCLEKAFEHWGWSAPKPER